MAGDFPLDNHLQWLESIPNKKFPIQLYIEELEMFPNNQFSLHWHKELEFLMVMEGTVSYQVGYSEVLLYPGDGIFVNSNMLHSFKMTENCKHSFCPNFIFLPEVIATPTMNILYTKYLAPFINNVNIPFLVLRSANPWQGAIIEHLKHIFGLLFFHQTPSNFQKIYPAHEFLPRSESECYELDVQIELLQILKIIYLHRKEMPEQAYEPKKIRIQTRMQDMLSFVHENYAKSITLEQIAASANISKSEASRCFHQWLDASPIEYLLQYRLTMSQRYLVNTTLSISEISSLCGFQSPSYFTKQYRNQFGNPPRTARS